MNAAIFGGTFNPIHIGHLFLAEEVVHQCGYDRIIFLPAYIAPHKQQNKDIMPEDRLEMIKLAIKDCPSFIIDTYEIEKCVVSYSIESISYLKNKYSLKKPGFIIGDDLIDDFHTWKKPERIVEETSIIVAHRLNRKEMYFNYPHIYVNNKILPVSSKDIRRRLRKNETVKYLVPERVLDYIMHKKLYII